MCAVYGFPFSSFIVSAFPWSAIINKLPLFSIILSNTLPTQVSTASMALMAASRFPVCPTISGFAKFTTTKSYFPMPSITFSTTLYADISGFKS